MLHNTYINLIIIVLDIIILGGIFAFTFYFIFTTYFKPSNVGFYSKFKQTLIRLSLTGAISTYVSNNSTVVELSDEELNELLEIVFREIGDSNEISAALLQSLGLYTSSVISYLEALGYIIF